MEPPVPPDESDCCNSGCNPCILDVYEAQLKKYKERVDRKETSEREINSISPTSYTIFTLSERKQIAPDVFLLRFVYGDAKKSVAPNCFKCNPGQYLLLRAKEFTRAYTPIPIESIDKLGFIILVRFYPVGRMSEFLREVQIGGGTSWRGPYGDFVIDYHYKYLLFVAQGTGIAPIFAVIYEILHNEQSESFVKLFFCCRDSNDILLREELYEFGSYWNFSCEIFLKNTESLARKYNEVIHERKLVMRDLNDYIREKHQLQAVICGSEAFGENIKKQIQALGIESNHIYLF